MGTFFASLMAGGVAGVAKAAGQLAIDVRTALTGEAALTNEQKANIIDRANAIEAANQALEAQAAQGQIDLNKIDAQSASLFKGGWRPAIGWVCVAGLAYTYLVRPVLPWLVQVGIVSFGGSLILPPMPALDMKELMSLVMALLGFGGFRMYEKIRKMPS